MPVTLTAVLLAMSVQSAVQPAQADEEQAEPIILPFETGWIRHMGANADDGTETCFADAEGAAFLRMAATMCPPGSPASTEAQRKKPHRLGMEGITVVTLEGERPGEAPTLTFGQLTTSEVEIVASADGNVRSCRRVSGDDGDDLCSSFARGEMRLMPFAGATDRRGRLIRSAGLCHAFDPGSCGPEAGQTVSPPPASR